MKKLTVRELIEQLQKCPGDIDKVVRLRMNNCLLVLHDTVEDADKIIAIIPDYIVDPTDGEDF